MEELRNEHNSLNFFTTEQLVKISQALAKDAKNLNPEVVQMLGLLCPSKDEEQLVRFAQDFMKNGASAVLDEEIADVVMADREVEEVLSPIDKLKQDANLAKLKSTFREVVVLACLIYHQNEASFEIMEDWCLDNDDNDELVQTIVTEFTKAQTVATISEDDQDDGEDPDFVVLESEDETKAKKIDDIFKRTFDGGIGHQLDSLWSDFLGLVSDLNIADFVNFKIVAVLLQRLYDMPGSEVKRVIPSNLVAGKPNLVVCAKHETHAMCLSLYSFDKDKPLPTVDEVLMCTPETTSEQVELICRR